MKCAIVDTFALHVCTGIKPNSNSNSKYIHYSCQTYKK